ncbi:MAG: hypothetical protein R3D86_13575 [Emcibacteraceae bacterium]
MQGSFLVAVFADFFGKIIQQAAVLIKAPGRGKGWPSVAEISSGKESVSKIWSILMLLKFLFFWSEPKKRGHLGRDFKLSGQFSGRKFFKPEMLIFFRMPFYPFNQKQVQIIKRLERHH